ncbi:hypothetical protein EDD86DRAFT_213123 [Gorgonomyces haynaldii]|nr:hypothetical protein EDD86DRAFT_213123 [Gorgonomyces haynaldii]
MYVENTHLFLFKRLFPVNHLIVDAHLSSQLYILTKHGYYTLPLLVLEQEINIDAYFHPLDTEFQCISCFSGKPVFWRSDLLRIHQTDYSMDIVHSFSGKGLLILQKHGYLVWPTEFHPLDTRFKYICQIHDKIILMGDTIVIDDDVLYFAVDQFHVFDNCLYFGHSKQWHRLQLGDRLSIEPLQGRHDTLFSYDNTLYGQSGNRIYILENQPTRVHEANLQLLSLIEQTENRIQHTHLQIQDIQNKRLWIQTERLLFNRIRNVYDPIRMELQTTITWKDHLQLLLSTSAPLIFPMTILVSLVSDQSHNHAFKIDKLLKWQQQIHIHSRQFPIHLSVGIATKHCVIPVDNFDIHLLDLCLIVASIGPRPNDATVTLQLETLHPEADLIQLFQFEQPLTNITLGYQSVRFSFKFQCKDNLQIHLRCPKDWIDLMIQSLTLRMPKLTVMMEHEP